MSLYEIRKKRLSNRYRLFMQYLKLVKENDSKVAYRLTDEIAEKEFDEEFLGTLIFSEKLKAIMFKHMVQLEKEVGDIFPHDDDKARDRIRNYCGKFNSIEIEFDVYNNGKHNSLGFRRGGMA